MSFGLCNAPATFQRCMQAIFSDLIEKCIEVFMDDFSVFGASYEICLKNLDTGWNGAKKPTWCLIGRSVTLWWQKELYLVTRSPQEALKFIKPRYMWLESFHRPWTSKEFKAFSAIGVSLRTSPKSQSHWATGSTKDKSFEFDNDCLNAFVCLNKRLTSAPNWNLNF